MAGIEPTLVEYQARRLPLRHTAARQRDENYSKITLRAFLTALSDLGFPLDK